MRVCTFRCGLIVGKMTVCRCYDLDVICMLNVCHQKVLFTIQPYTGMWIQNRVEFEKDYFWYLVNSSLS